MGYDLTSVNVPQPDEAALEKLVDDAMEKVGDARTIEAMNARMQAAYDALASTSYYFRFNQVAWPKLLRLAVAHGWQPMERWEEYTKQNGRLMPEADALGLADALGRALITLRKVVPLQASHGPLPPGLRPSWVSDDLDIDVHGPRLDLSPEAFWSGNQRKIRRFVVFARQGPFQIH